MDERIISTDSGLRYVDLVEGTGTSPSTGDTVTVHYTGWLENGTKFDSSVDCGQPTTHGDVSEQRRRSPSLPVEAPSRRVPSRIHGGRSHPAVRARICPGMGRASRRSRVWP